jgi:hypothetical protein
MYLSARSRYVEVLAPLLLPPFPSNTPPPNFALEGPLRQIGWGHTFVFRSGAGNLSKIEGVTPMALS